MKEPGNELAATGRRIELPIAEVFQFRDGKIADFWSCFDAFTFFRQLGIGAPEVGAGAQGATGAGDPVH